MLGEYEILAVLRLIHFVVEAHKTEVRKMLNNATSTISREYHIGRGFRGYAVKLTDE
jgi:hypothetical protein